MLAMIDSASGMQHLVEIDFLVHTYIIKLGSLELDIP
jgi:hypothetical protein